MIRTNYSALSLVGVLLITMTGLLPTTGFAKDGYRDSTSVKVDYRGRDGHRDRGGDRVRGGYKYRESRGYDHHRPHGHAYGYYTRPRAPVTYIVVPSYPRYYTPRYYDGGRSGWELDLHYYLRD